MSWGTFTWRKSEQAMDIAKQVFSKTDRLELKLAEKYLTKDDFELQMARLFVTLDRLEHKLDTRLVEHANEIRSINSSLKNSNRAD
jgi:hypothetical protein